VSVHATLQTPSLAMCTTGDHRTAQWQQSAKSADKDPGSEDSSDSDNEPPAADHPDYHGRGWQPSQTKQKPQQLPPGIAAAAASDASSKDGGWDAIDTDSSDSDDAGRSRQPLKEVSTRSQPPPAGPLE
jgi:hypothetical protein